jgi:5-methyltetrahydrofolate--homocysteine methyltransferase
MNTTYIPDWQRVYDRFEEWWHCADVKKPLMRLIASGKKGKCVSLETPNEPSFLYLNPYYIVTDYRNFCENHYFLSDAYPNVNVDLGPGSMALYLGAEPKFTRDTVWYKEFMNNPEGFNYLSFDANNKWWLKHQEIVRETVKLANDDFYVNIPDIIENIDILSALRGSQNLCLDIIDEDETVKQGIEKIDTLYFTYYDAFYDMVKSPEGIVSYTVFNILGKGKIAKIQCDFSALISPEMFRAFVQPSLRKQCRELNCSLYHLDGPDAIKHVEALMEIKELNALQWTCGAGKPDGGSEQWYPIYDKVHDAGKALWIMLYDGSPKDWAEAAKKLIQRYGKKGIYILPPVFPDLSTAEEFSFLFA